MRRWAFWTTSDTRRAATVTEQPTTEQPHAGDVGLVVEAIPDWFKLGPHNRALIARKVVAALAAAGRLRPEGASAEVADLVEALDQARTAFDQLMTQHLVMRKVLADCVVKATPYGIQDGDFIASYILPTGPIHRAIPALAAENVHVRPGFDGRSVHINEESTDR